MGHAPPVVWRQWVGGVHRRLVVRPVVLSLPFELMRGFFHGCSGQAVVDDLLLGWWRSLQPSRTDRARREGRGGGHRRGHRRAAARGARRPQPLQQRADAAGSRAFFFSSRRRHTISVSAFLLNRSSDLISTTPVIAGDSFEMDAVGALRLSPLRRGLAIDSTVDIFTFYVPHRHVYGEQWIKFMKDGVNATPLPTVNTTGYIDHAAFLGTINPDTNKIPKHLFQGYLNIYNNYFKAPWMPDRTEANPNELNQDDARYGFRCCHLKNIWTAPLPPETELSRQMTTSTTSIDIMGLQAAYANLHTDQERDYFMQRYHDVISSFGGKTSYDADNRPLLVMRSNLWASGYDVD